MVTGIETAGLALATLPLIVNQAESYVQGFETLKTFQNRRYRRDVKSYYNSLCTQRALLVNTLERSLENVIEHEEDISKLINDTSGPSWHEPALQDMLREKFGRDFDSFISTMTELAGLLDEFAQKLEIPTKQPLKTPELLWRNTSTTERELRKIKVILSKSIYTDYMNKIKSANVTLQTLLEHSEHREKISRKQRLPKRELQKFKTARRVAHSLYGIISRGELWDCQCRDQHRVQIQINVSSSVDTSSSELPRFRLTFTSKASPEPTTTWYCQEVETESSMMSEPTAEAKSATKKAKFAVERETKVGSALVASTLQSVPWPKVDKTSLGLPIKDLCTALSGIRASSMCEKRKLIGFLSDQNHRHSFYAIGDSITNLQLQSLEALLMPSKNRMKFQEPASILRRWDRLRLAASLASSVFQFHGSWLKAQWRAKDIMLRISESRNEAPGLVYLVQQPPEVTDQFGPPTSQKNGVSAHLIRNEILFSLGLALVELSLGQTIASLRKPEDDDPVEAVANLKTALRLRPDVLNESGMRYEEVVDKCLVWPGRKDTKFDDEDFQRTMFDSIISPLLEDLKIFGGEYQIH